jgi:branched-subunit amino acid ABC-type transport system permease component
VTITAEILAQLAWTGFATSSYYALFAAAFALVLKVNRVWNFAQAGVMVFAYFGMFAGLRLFEWPTWSAVLCGLAVAIMVSWLLENYGFRVLRQRKSPLLTYFIFTIVFAQLSVYLAELFFGTDPKSLYPSLVSPVFLLNGIVISHWDIMALSVAGVLLAALCLFFLFTKEGRFLTAVADDPDLAELYGISKRRAYGIAMAISAVLLTAGMYLFGTKASIFPSTPLNQLLVFAVVATILAGLGNVFAAAVAAVFLGLFQAFSILVINSKWQVLLVYIMIFVAIIFFPKGVRLPANWRKLRRSEAAPQNTAQSESTTTNSGA